MIFFQTFKPNLFAKNVRIKACPSTILIIGFPDPWPASISVKINAVLLLFAQPIAAAILRECNGSTRVSLFAVVNKKSGYLVPAFTL